MVPPPCSTLYVLRLHQRAAARGDDEMITLRKLLYGLGLARENAARRILRKISLTVMPVFFYVQVHIDKLHIERGGQATADRGLAAARKPLKTILPDFMISPFTFFVHFPFPVSFGSLCAEKPCRFRFRIADELFDILCP